MRYFLISLNLCRHMLGLCFPDPLYFIWILKCHTYCDIELNVNIWMLGWVHWNFTFGVHLFEHTLNHKVQFCFLFYNIFSEPNIWLEREFPNVILTKRLSSHWMSVFFRADCCENTLNLYSEDTGINPLLSYRFDWSFPWLFCLSRKFQVSFLKEASSTFFTCSHPFFHLTWCCITSGIETFSLTPKNQSNYPYYLTEFTTVENRSTNGAK
jgi:hypothetical protein